MKKRMAVVISLVATLLGLVSHAEVTDLLKPEYQRQEQDFKRVMERLVTEGVKYQIVTEKVERKDKMGWSYTVNEKTVKLPKDVTQRILKYNPRLVRWHIPFYLDDEKSSFYAAILILGRGMRTDYPESIIKHDKNLWWKQDLSPKRGLFIEMCSYRHALSGKRGRISQESYFGAVLFESMPLYYNADVFPQRIYDKDWFTHEPSAITPSGGEYAKFFEGFLKDGDKSVLKEITLTQPCVEHWIWLTLFGEEGKRLLSLEGLLAWSRINLPVENPFLSALAMGLFTINGYAFNDGTGVYTMNERGRMLMDFIAEFPIPENATRLQAVMNGGNKDEIQAMMKKHGTEEKWAELLKNPVHPEFAKYPQDD